MTGQLFRDYVKKNRLNLEQVEEQNEILTKKIDNQVRDLLNNSGNLIVDGWMSGISAGKTEAVLKILLVCSDEIRYKRFAKREKINFESAKKMVEERQAHWFTKMKAIHKINPIEYTNGKNYDLIIDTSYMTSQTVLKKVMDSLK